MAFESLSTLAGEGWLEERRHRSGRRASGIPIAEPRVKLAAADRGKPQPHELFPKLFTSRRTARIANDQELAARCYRRGSHWADVIREGLDPDIARFVHDQAVAWQLLSGSYARSTRDALIGPEVTI